MKRTFVLLTAIAIVVGLSITNAAAFRTSISPDTTFKFYGSYKMNCFWIDSEGPYSIAGGENQNRDDDQDFQLRGISTSRIGGYFTTDTLKGHFEVGFKREKDPVDALELQMRILSAEWDFGKAKLLVGHDYTPLYFSYAAQAFGDFGAQGVGNHYVGRHNQISFDLKNGVKFGFIEVTKESNLGVAGSDVDVVLPKFEISYEKRFKNFSYNLGAGIQHYKLVNDDADLDEDILAWETAAAVKYKIGRGGIWVGLHYGQNIEQYDAMNAMGRATASVIDGDVKNCDTWGGAATVFYYFSKQWISFLGVGYQANNVDDDPNRPETDDIGTVYWNVVYIPRTKVYIAPEIGIVDMMDGYDGKDEGVKSLYAGIFLRVDF